MEKRFGGRMISNVFAEIGFGNETFLSTEFEKGETEYRVKGFLTPKKINSFYLRFWIFKIVLILDTKDIIKISKKDRNKLKILFGIAGINKK